MTVSSTPAGTTGVLHSWSSISLLLVPSSPINISNSQVLLSTLCTRLTLGNLEACVSRSLCSFSYHLNNTLNSISQLCMHRPNPRISFLVFKLLPHWQPYDEFLNLLQIHVPYHLVETFDILESKGSEPLHALYLMANSICQFVFHQPFAFTCQWTNFSFATFLVCLLGGTL